MLLEEAFQNHAYPVRHKLKDYYMMRSFISSGTLTWERYDTISRGKHHHDGLQGTLPIREFSHI
jgi:hypothetical protein